MHHKHNLVISLVPKGSLMCECGRLCVNVFLVMSMNKLTHDMNILTTSDVHAPHEPTDIVTYIYIYIYTHSYLFKYIYIVFLYKKKNIYIFIFYLFLYKQIFKYIYIIQRTLYVHTSHYPADIVFCLKCFIYIQNIWYIFFHIWFWPIILQVTLNGSRGPLLSGSIQNVSELRPKCLYSSQDCSYTAAETHIVSI